jgi:hypothetical protein
MRCRDEGLLADAAPREGHSFVKHERDVGDGNRDQSHKYLRGRARACRWLFVRVIFLGRVIVILQLGGPGSEENKTRRLTRIVYRNPQTGLSSSPDHPSRLGGHRRCAVRGVKKKD